MLNDGFALDVSMVPCSQFHNVALAIVGWYVSESAQRRYACVDIVRGGALLEEECSPCCGTEKSSIFQ